MSLNNDLDFEQTDRQSDTSAQPMLGGMVQIISSPIFVISSLFTILFGVAFVIIISLIPVYLGNKGSSSTLYQDSTLLSATYKTDLSDQTSFTITDINTLNQQLKQAFHLRRIDLSIISYYFNSGTTSSATKRKKRAVGSIQCEDSSTFSNVSLNFQFSVAPTKEEYTTYQWQQFINKMQNDMRSVYKQMNMQIPFSDGQTKSVQLTYCSSEIPSNNTVSTTTSNKTRLNCEVVILGAGIGGSHSAYRLASRLKNNLCIFERENHVGGRTYDIDSNGNVPAAYSTSSISSLGAARFYDVQPVIKQLADELNVSYHQYDYQTSLIKARGKFYTAYDDMCSGSYINLSCADTSDGINAQDQLWIRLIEEFQRNASNLYHFADFNAYCRSLLGDEATEYLRDSFRFRGDFLNADPYSYMEYTVQDWNLAGAVYYPNQGLSQLSKRMIYQATTSNNVRLYLNEEVLQINENTNNNSVFLIETTRYEIFANQLVLAIPPSGWTNIQGSIGNEIKADAHFQSILPVKTIVIDNYWPRRWWEESADFGTSIDRAWTRQNCISFIEIYSQRPPLKSENLTRTVYDDGACVEPWSALIQRSSKTDLIEEILRGLRAIFIDVDIPSPLKTFPQIWPGAWHFQRSNSNFTNQQIVNWALQPITRFKKNQITLVGEAYNINRSGWTDGAVKSSLMSLSSQFNLNLPCYDDDAASNGNYCSQDYI